MSAPPMSETTRVMLQMFGMMSSEQQQQLLRSNPELLALASAPPASTTAAPASTTAAQQSSAIPESAQSPSADDDIFTPFKKEAEGVAPNTGVIGREQGVGSFTGSASESFASNQAAAGLVTMATIVATNNSGANQSGATMSGGGFSPNPAPKQTQPMPPKALDADAEADANSESSHGDAHDSAAFASHQATKGTFSKEASHNVAPIETIGNYDAAPYDYQQQPPNSYSYAGAPPRQPYSAPPFANLPNQTKPQQQFYYDPSNPTGPLYAVPEPRPQPQPRSSPVTQLEIRNAKQQQPGKRFPTKLTEHGGEITGQTENAGTAAVTKARQSIPEGAIYSPEEEAKGKTKANCHGGLISALSGNPNVRIVALDSAPECLGVIEVVTKVIVTTNSASAQQQHLEEEEGAAESDSGSLTKAEPTAVWTETEKSETEEEGQKPAITITAASPTEAENLTSEAENVTSEDVTSTKGNDADAPSETPTTTIKKSVSVSVTTAVPTALYMDPQSSVGVPNSQFGVPPKTGRGVAIVVPWPTRVVSDADGHHRHILAQKALEALGETNEDGIPIEITNASDDEGGDEDDFYGSSESRRLVTESHSYETFKASTTISMNVKQFPPPNFDGLAGGRVPKERRCLVLQNIPIGVEGVILNEIVNGAIAAALAFGPPATISSKFIGSDDYKHETISKDEVAGNVPLGVRVAILGDEIGLGRTGRYRHVSTWFEILKLPDWGAKRLEAAFVLMDSRQCIIVPAAPEIEDVCIALKDSLERYRKKSAEQTKSMNGFLNFLDNQLHALVLRHKQGLLSSALQIIEHVIELGNLSEHTKRHLFFPDIPTNFTRFQFVKTGCQLPQDDVTPYDLATTSGTELAQREFAQRRPAAPMARPVGFPPPSVNSEPAFGPQSQRNYNMGAFSNNSVPSTFYNKAAQQRTMPMAQQQQQLAYKMMLNQNPVFNRPAPPPVSAPQPPIRGGPPPAIDGDESLRSSHPSNTSHQSHNALSALNSQMYSGERRLSGVSSIEAEPSESLARLSHPSSSIASSQHSFIPNQQSLVMQPYGGYMPGMGHPGFMTGFMPQPMVHQLPPLSGNTASPPLASVASPLGVPPLAGDSSTAVAVASTASAFGSGHSNDSTNESSHSVNLPPLAHAHPNMAMPMPMPYFTPEMAGYANYPMMPMYGAYSMMPQQMPYGMMQMPFPQTPMFTPPQSNTQ